MSAFPFIFHAGVNVIPLVTKDEIKALNCPLTNKLMQVG
jgi:hypothetical protein